MPDVYLIHALRSRISELQAQLAWGREHPYAGVCGEDDAAADRLQDLQEQLAALEGHGDEPWNVPPRVL